MGAAESRNDERSMATSRASRKEALPVLRTPDEVAGWLGITRKSLYNMVDRGQIPGSAIVRIGTRIRFDESRLKDWIAEKRAAPSKE